MIPVTPYCVSENESLEGLHRVLKKKVSTSYGSGFALVCDESGRALGTLTDADLRNFLAKGKQRHLSLGELARRDFIWISSQVPAEARAEHVLQKLEERGWATELPVALVPVLDDGIPVGLIEIQHSNFSLLNFRDTHFVFGLGYVGLTLTAALAETGLRVVGYDNDAEKVAAYISGRASNGEPGVLPLIEESLGKNLRLVSSLEPDYFIEPGRRSTFLVCVGTPVSNSREPQFDALDKALSEIMEHIQRGDLVILRSTVPIGTARSWARQIEQQFGWQVGLDFYLAMAPERTVEGDALKEVRTLPQIIGGVTPECAREASGVFAHLVDSAVLVENTEAAELSKLMTNSYRDYVFAFSNHISGIARDFNIDVNRLIDQTNSGYSRAQIPQPSPGVGGPCLTKDSWILESSRPNAMDSPVLKARLRNEAVIEELVQWLHKLLEEARVSKVMGLGMAFKGSPPTNDLRGSTGIEILLGLARAGFEVSAWDDLVKDSEFPREIVSRQKSPEAILLLNNNPANATKLTKILDDAVESIRLIFDPWDLLDSRFFRGSRFRSQVLFVGMSHVRTLQGRK